MKDSANLLLPLLLSEHFLLLLDHHRLVLDG